MGGSGGEWYLPLIIKGLMSLEIQQQQQASQTTLKKGSFGVQKTGFADLMCSIESKGSSSASTASKSTKEVRITNAVENACSKYNLPPALVLGVIKQESGFKPQAESHCGAQGLMQLMPGTAQNMGVKDSFSIEQNIDGGCKYLRKMLDRFDGNVNHALAAYNAGPGNVEKYKGVPPFAETKNYVKSVVAHAEKFQGGKLDIPSVPETTKVEASQPVVSKPTVTTVSSTQDTAQTSAMSRQEIREAISTIMVTAQQPEIKMPERSKNELAEEPPPPPPSYARRV